MVKLVESDILTKEVLTWKGIHLFHFMSSSCSQKTRICLNLKGIEWESHQLDLGNGENYSEFYLGINPRGLVPTLVIDGQVHIESNDILIFLDSKFPEVRLIPQGMETQMKEMLRLEDELHLDLRTLTFRFTQPRGKEPRSKETLQNFRERGTGRVLGNVDPDKEREIQFWKNVAENGITDGAVRNSVRKFRFALNELNDRLKKDPHLLGEELTVLDVAWVVYVNRLVRCGYPLEQLHPKVSEWFWPLRNKPESDRELKVPPNIQAAVEANHKLQKDMGATLVDVADFQNL